MKKWQILISESARKDYYSLDDNIRDKVKSSFNEIRENPFKTRSKADIKKLKGSRNPAFYRLRIGSYRVIYSVEQSEVKITRIIPRKKGYSWLD